jgi:hypothetical protein
VEGRALVDRDPTLTAAGVEGEDEPLLPTADVDHAALVVEDLQRPQQTETHLFHPTSPGPGEVTAERARLDRCLQRRRQAVGQRPASGPWDDCTTPTPARPT